MFLDVVVVEVGVGVVGFAFVVVVRERLERKVIGTNVYSMRSAMCAIVMTERRKERKKERKTKKNRFVAFSSSKDSMLLLLDRNVGFLSAVVLCPAVTLEKRSSIERKRQRKTFD